MANTNYPSADSPQNRPVKNSNNTTKNILIGVLAAGLLGTWAYFLYDKNDSTKQIQVKTAEANTAMTARDSVRSLYNDALTRLDSITGSNSNLQGALNDSVRNH